MWFDQQLTRLKQTVSLLCYWWVLHKSHWSLVAKPLTLGIFSDVIKCDKSNVDFAWWQYFVNWSLAVHASFCSPWPYFKGTVASNSLNCVSVSVNCHPIKFKVSLLRTSEAWDTTRGHKSKEITPSITWRREAQKEEAIIDLPWEDEKGPSSIRPTLELFQGQHWGNSWLRDWVEHIMGFPERIDSILNWTVSHINKIILAKGSRLAWW